MLFDSTTTNYAGSLTSPPFTSLEPRSARTSSSLQSPPGFGESWQCNVFPLSLKNYLEIHVFMRYRGSFTLLPNGKQCHRHKIKISISVAPRRE